MANYSGPPLSSTPGRDAAWHQMRQNRDPNVVSDAERELMWENARRYQASAQADHREMLQREASRQRRLNDIRATQPPIYATWSDPSTLDRLREIARVDPPVPVPEPEPDPSPGHRQLDLEPAREVQIPTVTVRKIEL